MHERERETKAIMRLNYNKCMSMKSISKRHTNLNNEMVFAEEPIFEAAQMGGVLYLEPNA